MRPMCSRGRPGDVIQLTASTLSPMRPLVALLLVAVPLLAQTPPEIVPEISTISLIDPGAPFEVFLGITNRGEAVARGVMVTISIDGVTEWRSLPSHCTQDGTRVSCSVGDIVP